MYGTKLCQIKNYLGQKEEIIKNYLGPMELPIAFKSGKEFTYLT